MEDIAVLNPIESKEVKKPKENSLDQLLSKLTAADEGMLDISLDDQLDLLESGRIKVDNYKYLVDKLEAQADLFKKWSKEFSDMEKSVRNNRKRLLDHMTYVMQRNGFEQFTGNRYQVRLQKSKPSVEVKAQASAVYKIHFPEMIKTEHSWDKSKLFEALKSGDEKVKNVAELKESVHPRFTINKGF